MPEKFQVSMFRNCHVLIWLFLVQTWFLKTKSGLIKSSC